MKKTIAFLLVAVMALSMTAAFASSPTNYNPPVEEVAADDLTVAVEETEEVAETLAAIEEVVKAGTPVIEYFPEETQEDVKAVLPAEVKAEELELNELVGLSVKGFEEVAKEADEIRIAIAFTTKYDPDQKVFPLIGLVDANGNVTWILVEGEVQADGSILLTIPADVLEQMGNAASVELAILNAPKA